MLEIIRINPDKQTLEVKQVQDRGLKMYYEETQCTQVQALGVAPNLVLLFDEEAKLKDKPFNTFKFDGIEILGHAILVRSNDDGDKVNTNGADLQLAINKISFPNQ